MKIDHLILGSYQTNSYILRKTEQSTDCVIIDTGLESDQLIDFLQDNELNPKALLLTHGHADHIGGVKSLRKNFPQIEVYIHKLDAEMLTSSIKNISILTGRILKLKSADCVLEDNQSLELVDLKLQVLHTPGHTPGGVSYCCEDEKIVFTGDALFADSVGRTDFPGGDMSQLVKSIKEKLFVLPEETIVYPGHGPRTTIGNEKKYNPFLR